jgi:tetratricopeptide (TPR) repeat protein
MPRGPALGTLITKKEGRDASSKYEFAIPLCDLLLDLVERDIDGPDALLFTKIAHSFAHDILHVATLASALLWYEGVTSDLDRSPDLVSISVNVEAGLAFLRSACDTINPAFARFAVPPEKRQISNSGKESFAGLLNWVGHGDPFPTDPKKRAEAEARTKANYELVRPSFHFLERHSNWFLHLRSLRTKLTHDGYSLVTYTGRVFLEAWLAPPGEAELQWLRGGYKQEDYREGDPPKFKRYRLLETLKEFTTNLLALANDLYTAISQETGVIPSGTHFLSGIHIPALSELLSYETPTVPNEKGFQYSLLRSKAWHLLRAGDYYGATTDGYPNHFWWRFKTRLTAICGRPPVRLSDGLRFGRSAFRWYVFCADGKHYGVLTDDQLHREEREIRNPAEALQAFSSRRHVDKVVLLIRNNAAIPADAGGNAGNDLILTESDPLVAAEKVYMALTGRPVELDQTNWNDAPHTELTEAEFPAEQAAWDTDPPDGTSVSGLVKQAMDAARSARFVEVIQICLAMRPEELSEPQRNDVIGILVKAAEESNGADADLRLKACELALKLLDSSRSKEDSPSNRSAMIVHASYSKGELLRAMERYEDAIAAFDACIEAGTGVHDVDQNCTTVAQAVFCKGLALASLASNSPERRAEQIQTCRELKRRYWGSSDPHVRQLLAKSLTNLGMALQREEQGTEALVVFREVISEFGQAESQLLYEPVAKSLVHSGHILRGQGDLDAALEAYDKVIQRFRKEPIESVRDPLAKAMASKGRVLERLDRWSEAVAAYDEMISQSAETKDASLDELAAEILIRKGRLLGQNAKYADALDAFDLFLRRFRSSTSPEIRAEIPWALEYMAVSLYCLERDNEALRYCDEVLSLGADVAGEKVISEAQELKAAVLKSVGESGKQGEDGTPPAE